MNQLVGCSLIENLQNQVLIFWIATPTVSAQLAFDCLASVPLGASEATNLVNSILPYVEWQSGEIAFTGFRRSENLQKSRYFVLERPSKRLPRTSSRSSC
jgi:hypothetical protein